MKHADAGPSPIPWRARMLRAPVATGLARAAAVPAAPALAQPPAYADPQAGRHYDLGAVVDVRRAAPGGLRVMAVTPGGTADRIGLRAGDMLQSINQQSLTGDARPAPVLEQAIRAGGGALRVELLRAGRPLSLSGSLDPRRPAAGAGCGQLSDRLDGLPATSHVRRIDITQIEGHGTPAAPSTRYPVAAGTRVVIVREHVPQPPQRPLSTYASKAMVLDVEADATYFIGARPIAGDGTGDAWQPFVWQTLKEPCR